MRRLLLVTALAAALLIPLAPARAIAAELTLTPAAQSVTKGGTVSLTVEIPTTGAAHQVSYVVVGRNDGVHGSVTTDASGKATISYRDHGSASSQTSDSVAVIDAADDLSATATVDYLDGPSYAGSVTLNTDGSAVDDASCAAEGTPATAVPLARMSVICAAVTNALGEPLAGKAVTFAVSPGAVGPADGGPASGATYAATTDRAGIAFAAVTSTTPGTQNVTATADHLAGHGSLGYAPPAPEDAAGISVKPATATFTAGKTQQFVATATDVYGNPVAGVDIGFAASGVGTLATSAASRIQTAADGTATTTLATRRGDVGAGTLTATILTAPAACSATTCAATASYTVARPVVPVSLALEAAPGASAGAIELVAAVVSGTDGAPAAGQLVHFRVGGADAVSGSARTNAKGIALFGYPAQRPGADTVRAWDDVNGDGRHQAAEPSGSLRLAIGTRRRERPLIQVSSPQAGWLRVRVVSRPALPGALVVFELVAPANPGTPRIRHLGRAHTDRQGVAVRTFFEPPGVWLAVRARVVGRRGVAPGVSRTVSIRVSRAEK